MIVIADSGSTNTNWIIIDNKKVIFSFNTKGLHPYFTTSDVITMELKENFPKELNTQDTQKVFFYGAGCSSESNKMIIQNGLQSFFKSSLIEVNDDLIAAARALFYHEQGIAIILGTGSNTGLYNGRKIIKKTPSLGYILGDEGSGAYLGKQLITDFLYNDLPQEIYEDLKDKYDLTKDKILNSVYNEAYPNKYLAGFTKFLDSYSDHSYTINLIESAFRDLFEKHICIYDNYTSLSIRATGSIAFIFEQTLKKVAKEYNTHIDLVIKEPINRLAQFHGKNLTK